MPRARVNEFYCIDIHNLEPGDLINALKALTEGRLSYFVSVGKDSTGKAHAFRFSLDQKMEQLIVLEPGDEEILIATMASRFQKNVGRVRYDTDKQEGVLHLAEPKAEKTKAQSFKFEPLPPFPGRLFERPLTWSEPVWIGSGNPPGRPERPKAGTPGYDVPLSKGSYIGAFAKWKGASLDAIKEEVDRQSTGELTLKATDGIEARVWLETGLVVGLVHDTIRGAAPEKTWDSIVSETFVQRRFRINVPRPDHIPLVKLATPKLFARKPGEKGSEKPSAEKAARKPGGEPDLAL